jgi:hypothetical protein
MLKSQLFYCKNKDTYPPFKNGLYLEEFFLNKMINENIKTKRKYIPILWTNFQIENWFASKKNEMQKVLDEWINENKCIDGYFTIVQYDDGPLLKLPENTIIYGACSGTIPIPLIYEDKNFTLENIEKYSYENKNILCSFVGNLTSNNVLPNVRQTLFDKFKNNKNFLMINSGGWTPNVNKTNQEQFIDITLKSKFSFAPRGYGRSSFRFFEIFKLGTIPIYVWNDINWLPFKNIIDYNKLCVVLNIKDIDNLEQILLSYTEEKYANALIYYEEIKYLFELEGMSNQIISETNLCIK